MTRTQAIIRFLIFVFFLLFGLSTPVVHAQTFTNVPVTYGQPFRDGDIPNCADAFIDGTETQTQNDVRNRWPDGSLKYAVISLIIPSYTVGQAIHIAYDNNANCNNSSPQTKAQLLAAGYNFDAQIQLAVNGNPFASARAILNAASACTNPGTDPEGSSSLCTYWLQGPIVTGVILEDRQGRTFDMNTDGGTGNPLHPIFECYFYPINNQVACGYTLENIWASTTGTSSARVQTYGVSLTLGNTSPVIEFASGTITHYVRARWHKVFSTATVTPVIDHNWRYWGQTDFTPSYDANLTIANSLISGTLNAFTGSNQALVTPPGGTIASGNWPQPTAFSDTGAAQPHGPLTTWDTIYLMSQNSTLLPVTLGNADLGGVIPYYYREADSNAGHGQTFDNSGIVGNVQTLGRIVSVNARTQVSLLDTTAQNCNTNFSADWINFGTGGQNVGPYGLGDNMSTSHSGQVNYLAYLTTGQYHYYEGTLMQGDYGFAGTKGTRACTQPTANGALRMGSAGYMYVDQERQMDWGTRDMMVAAFIAVDGSPEKAYLEQKLHANVAVMEGARGLPNDYPAEAAAYAYGQNSRSGCSPNSIATNTTLGVWTCGLAAYTTNAPLNQTGAACAPSCIPASADSNFQTAYSGVMVGWLNDLGYCPSQCSMLNLIANRYLNETLNPASNVFHLTDYVFPTLDSAGAQITTWAEDQTFYANQSSIWPAPGNVTIDDSYGPDGVAVVSYMTRITSSQGGFSGLTAWNKLHTILVTTGYYNTPGFDFPSASPKYDFVPRSLALQTFNVPQSSSSGGTPTVSFSPTSLSFPNQLVSTTSAPQTLTLTNTGTATLTWSSLTVTFTAGQQFMLVGSGINPCGATGSLAPGIACTSTVTYSPTAFGSATGSVILMDNASGSPHTVALTGNSILTPAKGLFAVAN